MDRSAPSVKSVSLDPRASPDSPAPPDHREQPETLESPDNLDSRVTSVSQVASDSPESAEKWAFLVTPVDQASPVGPVFADRSDLLGRWERPVLTELLGRRVTRAGLVIRGRQDSPETLVLLGHRGREEWMETEVRQAFRVWPAASAPPEKQVSLLCIALDRV